MLATEWNWEDALAVRFEEGMEQGFDRGMAEGMEQGMKDVALNALAKGLPIELIHEITGLNIETIENLTRGHVVPSVRDTEGE